MTMMGERDILWRVREVSLGVRPARLSGITLDIHRGVTAALGPSGAGKSSLLNLLVGFETPESGTVERVLAASEGALPVYWVPQGGGLWPHLTAREHVALAAPAPADAESVRATLAAFEIEELAGRRPAELSQGERSRVALARGFAARPAVLVMDEPLSDVDAARAARLWRRMRGMVRERGLSLVYATHSPRRVVGEADEVLCLRDGRVLFHGPVEELYWRPPTAEAAESLGETNWLTPEEARLWLGREEAAARSFRPEQIAVTPAPEGPAIVVESRFHGASAEVELRHAATGAERLFRHRPAGALRAGTAVRVQALLLLLVALLAGCSGGQEPVLKVSEAHLWSVPAEGKTLPAARGMNVGARGEVYALDTIGRVLVYGADGEVTRQWRMPDATVGRPEGILELKDGRVAVADTHYHRVVYFDAAGKVLGMFGQRGSGPGEFIYPVSLTQDDAGNLYVAEYGSNDRVQKFAPEGRHLLSFGSFGTGPGQFQRPSGIVWCEGRIYVADAINNRVQVFTDAGALVGVLGGARPPALQYPYDIKLGPDRTLYAVEYAAGRVTRLDREGRVLGRYGRTGSELGRFSTPWGIAVDARGRIYVGDTGNRRIVELVP
jgi:ABC-type Fe3+/spermidine/putrescine transport system ATPase subunit/sugar lactone lactonase YvrE